MLMACCSSHSKSMWPWWTMKRRNSAQREEPVLEFNNLHQRMLSRWTKEHGIIYVELLYKSNFLEDKSMTVYSPVSLLPQRSVSVAHFYLCQNSKWLDTIHLIVEEWLHKMCNKTFARKPFVMTRFCAIVQWSSSSSILSRHTVTLSTTVPCHQLKCTWRSCSCLSIWLHWENLLFLALQSLQWPQCY